MITQNIEKDIILASLLLHDGWKQGKGTEALTIHSHPLFAVDNLKDKINP